MTEQHERPKTSLYKAIAIALQARKNCELSNNRIWLDKWTDKIRLYQDDCLPSGSGIDRGCEILDDCVKLQITFDYHFFMDSNGHYDGWESYKLVISSDLASDFTMRIIGKNRDNIKGYFYEMFDCALRELVD